MAIESRIYVLRLLIALLLLSTEGIHIYLHTVYLKLSVASLVFRTLQTLKVRFRGGGGVRNCREVRLTPSLNSGYFLPETQRENRRRRGILKMCIFLYGEY